MPDDDNLPTTATVPNTCLFSVLRFDTGRTRQLALAQPSLYPELSTESLLSRGKCRTTTTSLSPHLSNASTVHAHPHLNAASTLPTLESLASAGTTNYFAAEPSKCDPALLVRGDQRKMRY
ncbi:hypothetical protein GWK47_019331 [Chionoecetes opilio]|uniref:Uncharacterized protein n=1 Tax=Chionoecetes opilio TaxID=41210 RepID=A0A8J5CIX6_CHIOP|nr:hypothetical protein GWK47_019331 [Chionoecetes opilio]